MPKDVQIAVLAAVIIAFIWAAQHMGEPYIPPVTAPNYWPN